VQKLRFKFETAVLFKAWTNDCISNVSIAINNVVLAHLHLESIVTITIYLMKQLKLDVISYASGLYLECSG